MKKNGKYYCDECEKFISESISDAPFVSGLVDKKHYCGGGCYVIKSNKEILSKVCPKCHQAILMTHYEKRGFVKCSICGFCVEEKNTLQCHEACLDSKEVSH
jgi:hypothetical protein